MDTQNRGASLPSFVIHRAKSIRLRLLDLSLYGLAQGEAPRPPQQPVGLQQPALSPSEVSREKLFQRRCTNPRALPGRAGKSK